MSTDITFSQLGLPDFLLQAMNDIGYKTPSPIQVQAIPCLLKGIDVLGQAQTGTGKTAAFALPLLANIKLDNRYPQALILAPTRELAMRITKAIKDFAVHLPALQILAIYGGQDYSEQLRKLRQGLHIVVGTPGRVIDHIKRGTLDLSKLNTLVLDEADEMLRMGFHEDVQWILSKSPENQQIALFSATMPKEIQNIADNYLTNPVIIKIKSDTATANGIKQQYSLTQAHEKFAMLTRILETEPTEGVIIFVKTRAETLELSEKLSQQGFASTALNGDVPQAQREKVVQQIKSGKIDILVATDVAARGLDVERINYVINYDMPHDVQSYIHRIGRTGRAGRLGSAIIFVTPSRQRMLSYIERTTKQPIIPFKLPSIEQINKQRLNKFKEKIGEVIKTENIKFYIQLLEEYSKESDFSELQIAAALASLVQGKTPLLLEKLKTSSYSSTTNSERPRRKREYEQPYARNNSSSNKSYGKNGSGGHNKPRDQVWKKGDGKKISRERRHG